MNRRDAIAALTALPEVTRLSVARPVPTDVIIVECTGRLSDEVAARIRSVLTEVWPNRKILVCDEAIRIRFAKEEE
jgi:hypothetical protein